MKTEPIKAKKYIAAYSCENGAGDMIIDREDADEAVNIAFKEGQSSPNIKQLEWDFYGTYHITETPVGRYVILGGDEQYLENYITCTLTYNGNLIADFNKFEEAKAAAQADFEKRIKECLE